MAHVGQFSDEVVNSILKHEDSGCCAFVARPDANVVSADDCRDADRVPRAWQRKETG